MKKSIKLSVLVMSIGIASFMSCKKKNDGGTTTAPHVAKCYLANVYSDGKKFASFIYNNANLITEIDNYDSTGKIVRGYTKNKYAGNLITEQDYYDTTGNFANYEMYVYDKNNNIIADHSFNADGTEYYRTYYTYSGGNVVADTAYSVTVNVNNLTTTVSLQGCNVYTWAGGNVSSVKYYSYDQYAMQFSLQSTDNYQYDKNANVFGGIIDGLFDPTSLNANNFINITTVYPSGSWNTNYSSNIEYNSAGNPVKETIYYSYGQEVDTYDYLCR